MMEEKSNMEGASSRNFDEKKQAKKQAARDAKKILFEQQSRQISKLIFDFIWAKHDFLNRKNTVLALDRISSNIEDEDYGFTEYMGNAVRVSQYLMREYLKIYFRFTVSVKNFKNDVKWMITNWLNNRTDNFIKVIDMCAIIAEAFLYCDFQGDVKMEFEETAELFEECFKDFSDDFYRKGGWKFFDATCYNLYAEMFKYLEPYMLNIDNVMHRRTVYDHILIENLKKFPVHYPIPSFAICQKCIEDHDKSDVHNIVFLRPYEEAMNLIFSIGQNAGLTESTNKNNLGAADIELVNEPKTRAVELTEKEKLLEERLFSAIENRPAAKTFDGELRECATDDYSIKIVKDNSVDLKSAFLVPAKMKSTKITKTETRQDSSETTDMKQPCTENETAKENKERQTLKDVTEVKISHPHIPMKQHLKPPPETLWTGSYPEPPISLEEAVEMIRRKLASESSNLKRLKTSLLGVEESTLLAETEKSLETETCIEIEGNLAYHGIEDKDLNITTPEIIPDTVLNENFESTKESEVSSNLIHPSCLSADLNLKDMDDRCGSVMQTSKADSSEGNKHFSPTTVLEENEPETVISHTKQFEMSGITGTSAISVNAPIATSTNEHLNELVVQKVGFCENNTDEANKVPPIGKIAEQSQNENKVKVIGLFLPEHYTFGIFKKTIVNYAGIDTTQPAASPEIFLFSEENSNYLENLYNKWKRENKILNDAESNLANYKNDSEKKLKKKRFIMTQFSCYFFGGSKNSWKKASETSETEGESPSKAARKKKRKSKSKSKLISIKEHNLPS